MELLAPPRVLVLSGEPFNWRSATGITLANLFHGWPRNYLFEVYTANVERGPEFQWPAWRISNADLALVGRVFGQSTGATNHVSTPTLAPTREEPIKDAARSWLAPWLDFAPYDPPPRLLAVLDEFRPQVIYSMLGNIRLCRLARALASRYNVSIVPHFMDDWPTTYSVPGRSTATIASRPVVQREVRRLMRQAPLGLSIGDAMAHEYAVRYSRPFEAFMNPVEMAPESVRQAAAGRARLGYIGGLHLSRHNNIVQIAHAVRKLKNEGLNVQFSVWAPPRDISQYGQTLTRAGALCGSLAPTEIQAELERLDIAIHTESFGKKESEYTRLSVSTKIPQYFASSLPVFSYGPVSAASCQYIVDNDCGVCVERSGPELTERLRAVINDPTTRLRMGANGRRLAADRHDAAKVRKRFLAALTQAATMRART